jgi:hypothetical protein
LNYETLVVRASCPLDMYPIIPGSAVIVYAKPTNVTIISINLIAINGAITPPKP